MGGGHKEGLGNPRVYKTVPQNEIKKIKIQAFQLLNNPSLSLHEISLFYDKSTISLGKKTPVMIINLYGHFHSIKFIFKNRKAKNTDLGCITTLYQQFSSPEFHTFFKILRSILVLFFLFQGSQSSE